MAPTLSKRIFCTMKVATVLDSSLPISMVRRHSGMISVDSRKLMTSVSSTCSKLTVSHKAMKEPVFHNAASLSV